MGRCNEESRIKMEQDFKREMRKCRFSSSKIWYFDEIIPQLVNYVSEKGRHNTQLLQTIRMLKIFGMISN